MRIMPMVIASAQRMMRTRNSPRCSRERHGVVGRLHRRPLLAASEGRLIRGASGAFMARVGTRSTLGVRLISASSAARIGASAARGPWRGASCHGGARSARWRLRRRSAAVGGSAAGVSTAGRPRAAGSWRRVGGASRVRGVAVGPGSAGAASASRPERDLRRLACGRLRRPRVGRGRTTIRRRPCAAGRPCRASPASARRARTHLATGSCCPSSSARRRPCRPGAAPRQLLRAEHDERQEQDHDDLAAREVEHAGSLRACHHLARRAATAPARSSTHRSRSPTAAPAHARENTLEAFAPRRCGSGRPGSRATSG